MKFLSRLTSIILFILFFGFELKNTQEVALRFFLDYEIRAPLVLMLLAFFAAGAVLGVLALTPTVFRYRRNISRQKAALSTTPGEADTPEQSRARPPQADAY
jgi:uncharacterized integral membrane protein